MSARLNHFHCKKGHDWFDKGTLSYCDRCEKQVYLDPERKPILCAGIGDGKPCKGKIWVNAKGDQCRMCQFLSDGYFDLG